MKNLIAVCSLFLLFSCARSKVEPIEKYKGKGLVVINRNYVAGLGNPDDAKLRVKSKDSIFFIYLTDFDAKDLEVGDTIK